MCTAHQRERGLTLLDLIVTIAIIALLMGVAIPNLDFFFRKQQADAQAHLLLRHLHKTRELAVYSGREMIVCGIDSNNVCSRDNFHTMAIFHDANENRKIDEVEKVESLLEFSFNGNIRLNASGTARYIRYYAHGAAQPYGSFILCPHSENAHLIRRVTNQMAGRAYLARPEANGIVANFDKSPINCGQ
jgi:type IV fimbrial biogenesis protein FimT